MYIQGYYNQFSIIDIKNTFENSNVNQNVITLGCGDNALGYGDLYIEMFLGNTLPEVEII